VRTDNIDWDTMFFGIAFWTAMRSKDPSTQCGACIARDNRPLGFGYNGFVNGLKDTPDRWEKEEKKKYLYHAEENAIRNSLTTDFSNTHLYLWTSNPLVYLPCERCARTICHYGIPNIHVLSDSDSVKTDDDDRWGSSLTINLFLECGIKIRHHDKKSIASILHKTAIKKLI
jgi:dCMP deaminase